MSDEKTTNTPEASPAVLTATITITRAATGKVETFDLVGIPDGEGQISATLTPTPQEQ